MEVSVRAGELRSAAAAAGRCASRNSPMPILNNILIEVRGDHVAVIGTDRYRHLVVRVPACGERTVPGRAVYAADRLTNLLGSLPSDAVVTLGDGPSTSTVSGADIYPASKFRVSFRSDDPELFPPVSAVPTGTTTPIVVSGPLFVFAAKKAGSTCDESRESKGKMLSGCRATFAMGSDGGPGRFRLAGTDRKQIAFLDVEASGSEDLNATMSAVIPGKDLVKAADIFADADAVEIYFDRLPKSMLLSRVWFRSRDLEFSVNLVEGRFPSISDEDFAAEPVEFTLDVAAGDLALAARQAEITVGAEQPEGVEPTFTTSLEIVGASMTLTTNIGRKGESSVDVVLPSDCGEKHGPYWIAAACLEEAVRFIDEAQVVRLSFPKREVTPICVRGDGWAYWFMMSSAPDIPVQKPKKRLARTG